MTWTIWVGASGSYAHEKPLVEHDLSTMVGGCARVSAYPLPSADLNAALD